MGRQDSHILRRDLLALEVVHIGLLVVEGHRTVLLAGEDLLDSRLELDQQPVALMRAVCAQNCQFGWE